MGTRLRPHTLTEPKCLLQVANKPIIDFQLEALSKRGISVVVVTGYHSEQVQARVKDRAKCVFNPLFEKGILHSIQAAKSELYGKAFIMMAGDVVFDEHILEITMQTEGSFVVAVDQKECDAEDSKAVIHNGKVVRMGKDVAAEVDGEVLTALVQIYCYDEDASKKVFDAVDLLIEKGEEKTYFMQAYNTLIGQGESVIPAFVKDIAHIEIDFDKDLEEARKMKWS